jgi:uncharacterized protein YgiM (DUF1202 family)
MRPRRTVFLRCLLVAAIAVLMGAGPARADSVKARRTARVYVKPGERSKVTTTVRAGKSMAVLGRKGRWLKVRVNGRVGWIVRTNIQSSQAREKKERTTRKRAFVSGRSKSRDLRRQSAPKDRYGLDAVSDEDAAVTEDRSARSRDSGESRRPKKVRKPKKPKKKSRARDEDEDEDVDFDDDLEGADDGDGGGEDWVSGQEAVVALAELDLLEEQSLDADDVGFAVEGETLKVLERDGDWVRVETAEGDAGWVEAERVRGSGSGGSGGSAGSSYQREGTAIDGFASFGYAAFAQSFRSDSAQFFGNYDISSAAMAFSLAGELIHDYSEKYVLGGELGFDFAISTPGIRVAEGDQVADTGFRVFDLDLIGKGGYKVHEPTGAVAFARLGYRYQAFQIVDVNDIGGNNLASLPSEALKGVVVGAELAVPRVTKKIAARLVIDTMLLLASRSQTSGLEDGLDSSAKAIAIGAVGSYQWKPNLEILGGYNYGWASTSWSGRADGSMRKHDATTAERTDTAHIFTVGAQRAF